MAYDSVYQAKWYEDHKDDLRKTRKAKYDTDAEYKKAAKKRAADRRALLRLPKPEGLDFTFDSVAAELGITVWSLRGWRKNEYYPEPQKFGGRMWFSSNQVGLLKELKDLIAKLGVRVGQSKRGLLEDMCNYVSANW
jgi:hypothetical protein